ncbi:MFS transporter [Actinocatenispora comari]|uniref:MFS transporter n=1 Tax=Actinocatenispora comari TaxID=2807577 RepID=A0A8J4ENN6_9ACTN|nr:MFS transporter [Actinocatenispora comari]GIL31672.1 MFS transporter [Actinocatenispora comari]
MSVTCEPVAAPPRRGFPALLVATVGAFANYAVLLPVVTAWAAHGGASPAGAGVTTSVFMLTTVLTQALVPLLGRRVGFHATFALGVAIMVPPTIGYALTDALPPLIAVSALRGIGFGLLSVSGSALVAELAPPERRGRASGAYGLAVALPNVALVPVAVAGVDLVGYPSLFVAITVVPLAAAAAILAIRRTPATHPPADTGRPPLAAIVGPVAVMLPIAVAATGIITFAPLSVPAASAAVLAVFGAAALAGRWGAGQLADRAPGTRAVRAILPVAVLGAGAGLALVGLGGHLGTGPGVAVALLGALLLGVGFGAAQNQTLVLLFERAGAGRHGTASAVWNMSLDAGTGVGGILLGTLATHAGFALAFALTAAALLATCLPLAHHTSRP